MFVKAIRLQEAQTRVGRAEADAEALARQMREAPEQEEFRVSYRRVVRELGQAREALAQVLAESSEQAETAN